MFANHQIWLLIVAAVGGLHASDGNKKKCGLYEYFEPFRARCRSCSIPCAISPALCRHFACEAYLNRHTTAKLSTSTNVEVTNVTASNVTSTLQPSPPPHSQSLNKNSKLPDLKFAISFPITIIVIIIIIIIIIKKRLAKEKKNRRPKKEVNSSDVEAENSMLPNDEQCDDEVHVDTATSRSVYRRNWSWKKMFRIDESSLKHVVKQLKSSIDMNAEPNVINVIRGTVLEGASRALNRKEFDPSKPITVEFIDNYGEAEAFEKAKKAGSIRREFFNLAMKEISESEMFVGPVSDKILVPSSIASDKDMYTIAGKLIALSIAHGCAGSHFFSPILFDLITTGRASPTISHVYQDDIRQQMIKIVSSTSTDQLKSAVNQASSFLETAGINIPIRRLEDKNKIVRAAAKFQVVDRAREAINMFTAGLSTLNVLETIKQHPTLFRPIFCGEPPELTATLIKDLFPPQVSPRGSNARKNEIKALANWMDYLQDTQDGETNASLRDILRFATGSEVIPPCGFDDTPRLEFVDGPLPMSNTCDCAMRIPKDHDSYESFKNAMDLGVLGSPFFGVAPADTEIAKGDTEIAKGDTEIAKGDTEIAKGDTEIAKGDTETAKGDTEIAKGDTEIAPADTELRQIP